MIKNNSQHKDNNISGLLKMLIPPKECGILFFELVKIYIDFRICPTMSDSLQKSKSLPCCSNSLFFRCKDSNILLTQAKYCYLYLCYNASRVGGVASYFISQVSWVFIIMSRRPEKPFASLTSRV